MVEHRHLDWPGCANVRDLGGLPLAGGGAIRDGALVRGDAPQQLTAEGWAALHAHGVRTVVDLRNDDERGPDAAPRPAGITTLELPHDGLEEDREFWGVRHVPPLYYAAHVRALPARTARVLSAIAHAPPGGVLVHCAGGRDRTGLVCALALHLAGAEDEAVVEDYLQSFPRLAPSYAARGEADQGALITTTLAARGTTPRASLLALLAELDVEAELARGGLTAGDVAALRARLAGA